MTMLMRSPVLGRPAFLLHPGTLATHLQKVDVLNRWRRKEGLTGRPTLGFQTRASSAEPSVGLQKARVLKKRAEIWFE